MPLILKIVDDLGNPDPVSSLADVVAEKVREKGVGLFRGENHVIEDVKTAINELIRAGEVSVHNPAVMSCHNCKTLVHIWHTYTDGTILCTDCKPIPGGE